MAWAVDHKARHAAYMREWRKSHPMSAEQRARDNARSYAAVYVKRGKIVRKPCEVCGLADSEMHHPDYRKPLLIVWLCKQHHALVERYKRAAVAGDARANPL